MYCLANPYGGGGWGVGALACDGYNGTVTVLEVDIVTAKVAVYG